MDTFDLEACIGGDQRAWNAFVDRWAGVIFSAVQRTMQAGGGAAERADVEDAVQDVFLRLVKDGCRLLRSYDAARSSLPTWLTLVARSTTIDRHRRLRLATVSLDGRDLPPAATDPGGAAGDQGGAGPALSVPLHLLTARQRLVLRLLFDDRMTVPQAARFMGVDEQTIRSTKHKALTRLRAVLAPEPTPGTPGTPGTTPGTPGTPARAPDEGMPGPAPSYHPGEPMP